MTVKPNFFILGQPRSGTTAMVSFLSQHPSVFMSEHKEPHYFCSDFHEERQKFFGDEPPVSNYLKDESSFLKLFEGAGSAHRVVGEASTHYLYSKTAAENIYRFNPDAKIMIFLREPVDFLSSLHKRWVLRTYETEPSFIRAVELSEERRDGRQVPPRIYCPSLLDYRSRAIYSEQLERVFKLFRPENVLVMIYDDYRRDNAAAWQQVSGFLGLDDSFIPEFKTVNQAKKPRSAVLNRVLHNKVVINIIRKTVPKFIRRWGDTVLWKNEKVEQVDSAAMAELRASFKEDVIKTSKLLNRDLAALWGYTNE